MGLRGQSFAAAFMARDPTLARHACDLGRGFGLVALFGAMEQPHRDFLRLCRSHDGRWLLWHLATDERRHLEAPSVGEWTLHFNTEGFGYVSDGARTMWAATLLSQSLHATEDGQFFMKGQGDDRCWLQGALQRHCFHTLSERLPLTDLRLTMFAFRMAWAGGRLWWSIADLHDSLRISTHASPKRWAHKGWSSWQNLCRHFGLQPCPHFRKPLADLRGETKDSELYMVRFQGPSCRDDVDIRIGRLLGVLEC